jgi:hypothetical protein
MTGPEHYREAEQHARMSAETFNDEPDFSAWHQGQAQVHATLALTAATAMSTWTEAGMPQPDRMDWWRAASGEPAERERVKNARAAELAEFATEATS